MAIEKLIWRDEEIVPIQTPSGADYEPRYDLLAADDSIIAAAARLRLANKVLAEGTPHNADNMNKLIQKSDAVGSFFYSPLGMDAVPLYDFPHAAMRSGWENLPPCPVEAGERAVACTRRVKLLRRVGILSQNRHRQSRKHGIMTGLCAYTDKGANSCGENAIYTHAT